MLTARELVFNSLTELFKQTQAQVTTGRVDQNAGEGLFIDVMNRGTTYESIGAANYDKTELVEIEVISHHPDCHIKLLEQASHAIVNQLLSDPALLICAKEPLSVHIKGVEVDDLGELNRAMCYLDVSIESIEEIEINHTGILKQIHFEIRPVEIADENQPVYEETYDTIQD